MSANYPYVIAFFGGSVGASEWLMLFIVVLIVVGPRKLPELARKFGRTMEMFRRAADEFKDQIMNMDREFNDSVSHVTGDSKDDSNEDYQDLNEAYGDDGYAYDEGAYDDADYPGNEDVAADYASETQNETADSEQLQPDESSAEHPYLKDLPDDSPENPRHVDGGSKEDV